MAEEKREEFNLKEVVDKFNEIIKNLESSVNYFTMTISGVADSLFNTTRILNVLNTELQNTFQNLKNIKQTFEQTQLGFVSLGKETKEATKSVKKIKFSIDNLFDILDIVKDQLLRLHKEVESKPGLLGKEAFAFELKSVFTILGSDIASYFANIITEQMFKKQEDIQEKIKNVLKADWVEELKKILVSIEELSAIGFKAFDNISDALKEYEDIRNRLKQQLEGFSKKYPELIVVLKSFKNAIDKAEEESEEILASYLKSIKSFESNLNVLRQYYIVGDNVRETLKQSFIDFVNELSSLNLEVLKLPSVQESLENIRRYFIELFKNIPKALEILTEEGGEELQKAYEELKDLREKYLTAEGEKTKKQLEKEYKQKSQEFLRSYRMALKSFFVSLMKETEEQQRKFAKKFFDEVLKNIEDFRETGEKFKHYYLREMEFFSDIYRGMGKIFILPRFFADVGVSIIEIVKFLRSEAGKERLAEVKDFFGGIRRFFKEKIFKGVKKERGVGEVERLREKGLEKTKSFFEDIKNLEEMKEEEKRFKKILPIKEEKLEKNVFGYIFKIFRSINISSFVAAIRMWIREQLAKRVYKLMPEELRRKGEVKVEGKEKMVEDLRKLGQIKGTGLGTGSVGGSALLKGLGKIGDAIKVFIEVWIGKKIIGGAINLIKRFIPKIWPKTWPKIWPGSRIWPKIWPGWREMGPLILLYIATVAEWAWATRKEGWHKWYYESLGLRFKPIRNVGDFINLLDEAPKEAIVQALPKVIPDVIKGQQKLDKAIKSYTESLKKMTHWQRFLHEELKKGKKREEIIKEYKERYGVSPVREGIESIKKIKSEERRVKLLERRREGILKEEKPTFPSSIKLEEKGPVSYLNNLIHLPTIKDLLNEIKIQLSEMREISKERFARLNKIFA